MCSLVMGGNDYDDATEKQYFDLLSSGGLTVPFSQIVEFVFVLLYLIMRIDLL